MLWLYSAYHNRIHVSPARALRSGFFLCCLTLRVRTYVLTHPE